uniref:Uncharacterized protein n=1 Tax=Caenorhabditis tropicalis TaxID=1561998 RepID=A0A1I7URH9_9PELO
MSSGLPPILAAAQPAANGFNFNAGFPGFSYLFPAIQQVNPNGSSPSNRFKVKRHRQRVDAGEPRNTYQVPGGVLFSREKGGLLGDG